MRTHVLVREQNYGVKMTNFQNGCLSQLELKNLGELIRSKRKIRGLTQQEVAHMVGLCSQHYSRIERGEFMPSLQTFFRLADVLDIDLGGLRVSDKNISSTMYEIMSLLEGFSNTQQKAVLSFLKTMRAEVNAY